MAHLFICLPVLFYLTILSSYGSIFALNCQNIRNDSLLCHNFVPTDLPKAIENVEIIDIVPKPRHYFKNGSFEGNGWSQVKRLRISTVDKNDSYIPWLILHNDTFSNLDSVEYLHLYIPAKLTIKSGAFKGLEQLKEFDLSGCTRTSVFYLILILQDMNAMPSLKVLRIDNMNAYRKPPTILTSFTENFFNALSLRNITEVYIRNTTITTLDIKAALKICDSVRVAEVSFSIISNLIITPTPCKSLKTVILTQLRRPSSLKSLHLKNKNKKMNIYIPLYYFRYIEALKLDRWLPERSTFINSSFTFVTETFKDLKEISIQNNLLQYMDVVIKTEGVRNLEKLELQGNIMQYLNGESFSSTPSLKMLNMSDNKIGIMQQLNTSHFEKLLSQLGKLKILDLSNNGLTYIPRDTFSCNVELKELYIQNNNIEQIALNSSFSLSIVDVRNNKISYLDETSRQWFDDNFDFHADRSTFNGKIDGNPFRCVCKYQGFLQWFINTPLIMNSSNAITCSDRGKDNITKQLTDELKEACALPIKLRNIAIASSVGFVSVIIVTIAAVVAWWRRRKRRERRRTLEEIIAQIQDGTYHYQFPVFLSYSNEDVDFVMAYIYPALVDHFRRLLDTPRDLVCIGDRHFTPGRGIHDEILRCLENSAVVLNVVSNEFCKSAYCRNELEQAYAMEKPILLLFIADVAEEEMTPLIRQLFKKYTRINMRAIGDAIQAVPSWEQVCKSILDSLPR